MMRILLALSLLLVATSANAELYKATITGNLEAAWFADRPDIQVDFTINLNDGTFELIGADWSDTRGWINSRSLSSGINLSTYDPLSLVTMFEGSGPQVADYEDDEVIQLFEYAVTEDTAWAGTRFTGDMVEVFSGGPVRIGRLEEIIILKETMEISMPLAYPLATVPIVVDFCDDNIGEREIQIVMRLDQGFHPMALVVPEPNASLMLPAMLLFRRRRR